MEDWPRDIFQYLISTTSRFTGTYDSPAMRVDHSWSLGSAQRVWQGVEEGPYSRNHLVLSVRIKKRQDDTIVISNYAYVGDQVCSALAVFFGKRFDNHGLLVGDGIHQVPDLHAARPLNYPTAGPFNHRPRSDFTVPLELGRLADLAPLFVDGGLKERFRHIFFAAARFYLRSLQMFDQEPEFAYLDLVTCGEILANYYNYDWDEVADEVTRSLLDRIRNEMQGGEKVVRHFMGRMRQIKRSYTLTLLQLLTDNFFSGSECSRQFLQLKKVDIEKRIKASYDLRSHYLHNGSSFGRWVQQHTWDLNEVPLGRPEMSDRSLSKTLSLAPTYLGMERVIRYCLVRFVHLHGFAIDSSLDDP